MLVPIFSFLSSFLRLWQFDRKRRSKWWSLFLEIGVRKMSVVLAIGRILKICQLFVSYGRHCTIKKWLSLMSVLIEVCMFVYWKLLLWIQISFLRLDSFCYLTKPYEWVQGVLSANEDKMWTMKPSGNGRQCQMRKIFNRKKTLQSFHPTADNSFRA